MAFNGVIANLLTVIRRSPGSNPGRRVLLLIFVELLIESEPRSTTYAFRWEVSPRTVVLKAG